MSASDLCRDFIYFSLALLQAEQEKGRDQVDQQDPDLEPLDYDLDISQEVEP